MRLRYLVSVCASALLVGCNQVSALVTATDDKINAAFPLEDATRSAFTSLIASIEGNPSEQKAITEEYSKLMGIRALTCTAKTPISRLDTIAKIKIKVTDIDCFQKQDVRLAEWIGLQRLAQTLAKPALIALSDLPDKALLPNFPEYSGQVTVAAQANVMVVKGAQRFIAVQLPSGKVINSIPIPEQTFRPASLSANGRVLAVPVGSRNLRMLDVESGNLLWSSEEFADLIAWLPQVQAALLTQANSGSAQLLDIKNGRIDAFPSTEKRLTWALPLAVATGKYLVGTSQTVSQMDISRTAQGVLEASPLLQWRLSGNGLSANTPFLMDDGNKLVYQSGSDLAWFNLADQQQGVWQLSALRAYGFAKLNEKAIAFETSASGTSPATTRVLTIDNNQVAVAKNMDVRDGTLVSLRPRSGYLKRSDSSVIIGTATDVESPQPLDKIVSEALLARQLTKIENQSGSNDVGNNSPQAVVKPLLTDLPSNARVSVVGVYEGTANPAANNLPHMPGNVRINVQPGSTPLVLVLASYEPVMWSVNTNGRKINKILVSGYYDSNVVGATNTPVIKIGSRYAYKLGSNEYNQLKQDIARYIENPVQLFQGAYTGREFSVN